MSVEVLNYRFVSPGGPTSGTTPDGLPFEISHLPAATVNHLALGIELTALAFAIDAEMHRDTGVIFTPEMHDHPDDASMCRCGPNAAKAAQDMRSPERTVLIRILAGTSYASPRTQAVDERRAP